MSQAEDKKPDSGGDKTPSATTAGGDGKKTPLAGGTPHAVGGGATPVTGVSRRGSVAAGAAPPALSAGTTRSGTATPGAAVAGLPAQLPPGLPRSGTATPGAVVQPLLSASEQQQAHAANVAAAFGLPPQLDANGRPIASSGSGLGGDDDSDDSSDGYDPQTGDLAVSTVMSEKRKAAILQRAQTKRDDAVKMTVDMSIQPLPPRRSNAQIRMTSRATLDEAREVIANDIGVPPRVVLDEETGYILPRESVVTFNKPIEVKDDQGNVSVVAAPITGYGLEKKFAEIEEAKTKEKTTVEHYERSVKALQHAKQQRLLRQLDLDGY